MSIRILSAALPVRRIFCSISSTRSFCSSKELLSFQELGVNESLVQGLKSLNIRKPNLVQQEFIPRLIRKENLVISASTGSGKTLAYCLPVIQSLVQEEESGYKRQNHRPRCLILVPTRELASQILSTVKSLSHHCKVSSCGVLGGESQDKQKNNLSQKVDIVVASPGRLLHHLAQRHVSLSDVRHIIIDEVDTMLMQGFGADLRKIMISATRGTPPQLIMASATITKAVRSLLEDTAGGFQVRSVGEDAPESRTQTGLKGSKERVFAMRRLSEEISRMPLPQGISVDVVDMDGVNRSLPNVTHVMVDTKGGDKLKTLEEIIVTHHNRNWKTMIFCNTITSCRAVAWFLDSLELPSSRHGSSSSFSSEPITSLSYHGDLNSEDRKTNLELFRNDPRKQYLVCSDIAARGIDIPEVHHVLMFDFPLNPIDFIHRTGRTGRMDAKGLVTAILTKRDRVLATAIQNAIATGQRLDLLSADKRFSQTSPLSEGSSAGGGILRAIPRSRSNARIVSDPTRPGILIKQSPTKFVSRTSRVLQRQREQEKQQQQGQQQRERGERQGQGRGRGGRGEREEWEEDREDREEMRARPRAAAGRGGGGQGAGERGRTTAGRGRTTAGRGSGGRGERGHTARQR